MDHPRVERALESATVTARAHVFTVAATSCACSSFSKPSEPMTTRTSSYGSCNRLAEVAQCPASLGAGTVASAWNGWGGVTDMIANPHFVRVGPQLGALLACALLSSRPRNSSAYAEVHALAPVIAVEASEERCVANA